MALPTWADFYTEILTAVHAAIPGISIAAGTQNAVWSSYEAVIFNVVEAAKRGGTGMASPPFVFIDAGEFMVDAEWGVSQFYYRAPIRIYYVDANVSQESVVTALNAIKSYFDLSTRQFTHFQVIETGAVHSSGGNAVMADLAAQVRTTLRGGYVSWDPGFLVGE